REIFVNAGTHTIRVELRGKEKSTELNVENGETAEVQLVLEDGSSLPASGLNESEPTLQDDPPRKAEPHRAKRNWVPAYVLGGVTVAALGTSLVFRGLAGGKKKDIDQLDSSDDQRCTSASSEC